MSAAIEGIQTCVHSGHSGSRDGYSILRANALTYPLVLLGFAFVGLIMQYCSSKAQEMLDEEFRSESVLDMSGKSSNNNNGCCKDRSALTKQSHDTKQLDATQCLAAALNSEPSCCAAVTQSRGSFSLTEHTCNSGPKTKYDLNKSRQDNNNRLGSSLECLTNLCSSEPCNTTTSAYNDASGGQSMVALKSFKYSPDTSAPIYVIDLETGVIQQDTATAISESSTLASLTRSSSSKATSAVAASPPISSRDDGWLYVRYWTSPLALSVNALILLLTQNDLMAEISDTILSIVVVTLLFGASFPPMKKAGKILLQIVPDGVDLEKLKQNLKTLDKSGAVISVEDLHVWSLTAHSNRVATCRLVLDKSKVRNGAQVSELVALAQSKFLEQNIKCTTIEPSFVISDKRNKEGALEGVPLCV